MENVAITGNGTITIDNRVLADLADGDIATLRFPNDLTTLKTGKNGNTLISSNQTGQQCELEIRVLRGSEDDIFLNSRLTSQKSNQPEFTLIVGEVVQNIGKGDGTLKKDTYRMRNGIFRGNVEVMFSAEGNTDTAVSVYTIEFGTMSRTIV